MRSIRTKSDDYSIIIDGMFMCHFEEERISKSAFGVNEKKTIVTVLFYLSVTF